MEPLTAGLEAAPGGGAIDWNEVWREAREHATRRGDPATWDRRAASFAAHAGRSVYVDQLLDLLAPAPGWTVLDVGCGPGTLALPLAARVRSVVALDFSPRMLELLRERCAARGVGNVLPVLGAWEDDWEALGLGRFDVALASRSLSVLDLRAALEKLEAAARLRVVVVAPVGDGPVDRRTYEAVGRTYVPGPDYRYVYNLLRQLGRDPDVTFIPVPDGHRYASLDEAASAQAWSLGETTPVERGKLRAWLEEALVATPEGLVFREPRTTEWAALAWRPAA